MQNLFTPRHESPFNQLMRGQSLPGLPAKSAKALRHLVLPTLLLSAGLWARPACATVPAPSAPDMTAASDSGFYSFDNLTNVTQPIFTGTGTAFATVTLYAGATPVGYGIVGPTGHWSSAPNTKLKDGSYTMTVRQTVKGVQSVPSSPLSISVDTVAPSAYQPFLTPDTNTGMFDDNCHTSITTPAFRGSSDPGTIISLYNLSVAGGEFLGKTIVWEPSTWKIPVNKAFPSGTHSYQIAIKASDMAGNVSAFSDALTVHIDTDKPVAPSNISLLGDFGLPATSNITNTPQPVFLVKSETRSKVELYDATTNELLGSAFADESGIANIHAPRPLLGDHMLYALCFDEAGNQSLVSNSFKFIIDTVSPTSTISTPKADAIVSAFPVVTGNATDYHGITQVKLQLVRVRKGLLFYWNGTTFVTDQSVTVNATLVPGNTTWKWDKQLPKASDLDTGSYILTAYSYDPAGNWETSDVRYFTLSSTRAGVPSAGTS